MTEIEIRNIVRDEMQLVSPLVKLHPRSTTKEECKVFGFERRWLGRNSHLFDGKRINMYVVLAFLKFV